MAKRRNNAQSSDPTGATTGYEAQLWQMADALRNNMDAAEYKRVVLGLVFLKYISDAFEAKYAELEAQKKQGADPEDPDEYRAASIFWVPKEARWQYLKASAPQPAIGTIVDDAMTAIERDNPSLKGVLPKDYARPGLDKQRLGQLINLVSDIAFTSPKSPAPTTPGAQIPLNPPLPKGEVKKFPPLKRGARGDLPRHPRLLQIRNPRRHPQARPRAHARPLRRRGSSRGRRREPFEEKMKRLTAQLATQFDESARLESIIQRNLANLGYSMEEIT